MVSKPNIKWVTGTIEKIDGTNLGFFKKIISRYESKKFWQEKNFILFYFL